MVRSFILLACIFLTIQFTLAQDFNIKSPDKRISLLVKVDKNISWSVTLDGRTIIEKVVIGMDFSEGPDLGEQAKVKKHNTGNVSELIIPTVPHKDSKIRDEYTELHLIFMDNYHLYFRAYNDGVAYQFVDDNDLKRNVITETMDLSFPENTRTLFPQEESMYSHNERLYLDKSLPEISSKEFCSLPVLFKSDNANVLFTETALQDYPGMFLRGSGSYTFHTQFPKFVLGTIPSPEGSDRNQNLTKLADYIAEISGKRSYPWRVFIIGNEDKVLVESNLSFQLAKPQVIDNTNWIKPGKVAWDWYNANNIYGVDFKSGLNTATYKFYIDFASDNGIEYVILDEGWTKSTTKILEFNPEINVKELIEYGKEKDVGIILWVLWKPLDENLEEILETYKSWGAKGIKVDFMQRNDQYMVNSYENIAKECAGLELLVDFHGAFKPSGLRRMYPNVINYEGVKGSENNKWSKDITPEHNVTIPFTRMAAGPMDYTPGAMKNANERDFSVSFDRPMSLGTRAHQVSMYVVYEAPLQMLCESPSTYKKEQATVDFITKIPTTWDETRVLHAAVGDYVVVARRKGEQWFLGAMTDWTPRSFEISLDFLDPGDYTIQIYSDGINADKFAEDYKIEEGEVNQSSKLNISLASGGGWTAIISKK